MLCRRPGSGACWTEEKRNGRATCADAVAGLAARGVADIEDTKEDEADFAAANVEGIDEGSRA